MAAMFDLPVAPKSESIHTSLTVLLDHENVELAVGILLLSYSKANLWDFAYVLPVNGGHL